MFMSLIFVYLDVICATVAFACCMVSLSARVSNNFIIQSSALLSFCLADFSRPFFDSTF